MTTHVQRRASNPHVLEPEADAAAQPARAEHSSPTAGERHVELSKIHDFASKLLQPEILSTLKDYVGWQVRLRNPSGKTLALDQAAKVPEFAPVSINLDITTACNFACDHCVDKDILNTGIKYQHEALLDSIKLMAAKGLRSVIVIGGGEPTVYPKFAETVSLMKSLGLQVAVVSNGSRMQRIAEVAGCLDENDWVRLSLDSGSDPVFQAMHKPKRAISLDQICEAVPTVKAINPRFKIGFSFIITWKGAFINETDIVENIHEMVMAAKRAKRYGFDYIAFKPFLTRAETNNAEIVDLREIDAHLEQTIARIRAQVNEAKQLEDEKFQVYETTNLKVLENKSYRSYMQQPHTCHMQFFRQVLSPLGMYNCPVYRNQPHGRVGGNDAYATLEVFEKTRTGTATLIRSFDAAEQCKEVTCLYNHVNWWIEDLIQHPEKLDAIKPQSLAEPDFFL
jgi:molybdenum cofactor biosynthesis enzyme MoaA